ncbi:MAG: hypothetical protein RLZZ393_1910 [Pseudomonadota bacterium]|jgi:uncharacterized repeat protein (TIGR01451 family)
MSGSRFLRSVLAATLVVFGGLGLAEAAPVTLKVVSARAESRWTNPSTQAVTGISKGAVVTHYKYLINVDNSGDTSTQRSPALGTGCNPADAGYPDSCKWTSIAGTASFAPVYTQGTQADFATAMNIPDGRYLISVLAPGFKLDGRHFKVANGIATWEGKSGAAPASEVLVEMQPWPLPDAQIQAAVFEDISPVNSAPDLPVEHGLAGFQAHITDYIGEVTTDIYGAPLCDTGACLSACYVVFNGQDIGTVQPLDAAGRCPTDPPTASTAMYYCDGPNGSTAPYMVARSDTAPYNRFACPSALGSVAVKQGPVPDAAALHTGVIQGKVKVPNIGPNRYALAVTPPDGYFWAQTTTLEGNSDWDAWVMEGATGLDTELAVAGEPFPGIIFGYVPQPGTSTAQTVRTYSAVSCRRGVTNCPYNIYPTLTGTSTITGVVEAVKIFVPATGGIAGLPGQIWGGMQGAKIDKPIEYPWVTLTDLSNGDSIVWAGRGDVQGRFSIPNVPAGTYTLTWWDQPQNEILDLVNVTVRAGETVDMGILPLTGWWTVFDGYVFNDANRNGIKDEGEAGIPNYTLTLRKRENSQMDRGTTAATTDSNGYYVFESAYPMTQWLVMEAYDDLHYTTGVTYQADNQPDPTTVIGSGVDVSVHPIIGLSGRIDWGKHIYDGTGTNGVDPRNGGIVGSISYDTTRNEKDPRYAAVEVWQPGVPDLTVKLWKPVPCNTHVGTPCSADRRYELAADGSYAKGLLLNTYLSETWTRPAGCTVRNADGTPLVHGVDEQVLPLDDTLPCIEAPLTGIQFGTYATDQGTPDANFGAAVNGNWGFGDGCLVSGFNTTTQACNNASEPLAALPAANYLVQVDLQSLKDAQGRPVYQVTREEDVNVAAGDEFAPAVPPPACVGALHVVDSSGNDGYLTGAGTAPAEGQQRPLCDVKLVTLTNGKSVAPMFNVFTDVPLPGRHWFIIIDDLNFSSNPKSTTFGEKAGIPFAPVGIYDFTNRLVKTVESDYNGLADVLLPSTNRINCPTPSGVCANLYRYVGNDPGVPGRLNTNYNPAFRTIAAEFEVLPGLIVPADLAPSQVGVTVQLPGSQVTTNLQCKVEDVAPELYAVSRPYVTVGNNASTAQRQFIIYGKAFGAAVGQVQLDGTALTATAVTWTNTQITVTVPTNTTQGPRQLTILAANGKRTVNGLTLHVMGNTYAPQLFEVGPNVANARYRPAETLPETANHAVQNALDDAGVWVGAGTNRTALVVVYPNTPAVGSRQNPRGAYYENLIITSRVKLQGVGPGSPDGSIRGSILDGSAYAGDSPVATDWRARLTQFGTFDANNNFIPGWAGNSAIYDGAVITLYLPSPSSTVLAERRQAFPTTYTAATAPSIDGFDIRGGDQQGFPTNINVIGGGPTGLAPGVVTQGGAIFANAWANNLQITNNTVQNNGGAYGTLRLGTPDLTGADPSSHNGNVVIAHNRVILNAGTNQAGGIGLFNGSDNYQIAFNDICGNFSAEYGGGISVVGYSPGGRINNNRIYFNRSYDEGGGVMIAGALPANAATLSPGSGAVDIYGNLIQGNLSNDDGGGIRFLMSGNFPMNVYNNFIVDNISTHEGGGISINDAPNVRIYNNTIAKNITTATAITSTGVPAPAGVSTSLNSGLLQDTLPAGSPLHSNPLLFNNLFWDNRAGTRTLDLVAGIGAANDTSPIDYWDLGVSDDPTVSLSPTNSLVQQDVAQHAYTTDASNKTTDPRFLTPYDIGVTFNVWRNNPAFLGAIMISADLPPSLMGDFHLRGNSPAVNVAANSKALPSYQVVGTATSVAAPSNDIDGDTRPALGARDIGGDEMLPVSADLRITKTDGVTAASPGDVLHYTITVTNSSANFVWGAWVRDTIPAALTNVSWTCVASTGSACAAVSGSGNISEYVDLAPAGTVTYVLTGTVSGAVGSTLSNTATVTPSLGTTDSNTTNNSATDTDQIAGTADLEVSISTDKSRYNRNENIRYTIVAKNNGPADVIGARLTDLFPTALTGVTWTCTATGGAACVPASGTGNLNAKTINLPMGGIVTLVATGRINSNAATINNTVSIALPAGAPFVDPNMANNTATASVTVNGHHVSSITGSGTRTSTTRWTANATITIHNRDHLAAAGVTVTGTWRNNGGGNTTTVTCTTNASGQCTVTRTNISTTEGSYTFTVTNLTVPASAGVSNYQNAINEVGATASVRVVRP